MDPDDSAEKETGCRVYEVCSLFVPDAAEEDIDKLIAGFHTNVTMVASG